MAKTNSKNSGKGEKESEKMGLPPSAILVLGIFLAVALLMIGIGVRHFYVKSSPSLKNSQRLLASGKPAEAKELLDRMPGQKRPDCRALLHRGKVLYALLLEQLREERWGSYGLNPDNWIKHPLAEEAERCFLDAMALSPNDPEIRRILGNLYREQGRFGDAEIILRSAIEIDDSNSEAFLTLGLLYAEGNRREAAHRALMAAWELDQGNPRIAKNIAFFYRFYADIPESSIVWFSRYVDSNPRRDPDINLIRAELRDLLERYPEFEDHRRDPDARINRGRGKNFVAPTQQRR
jgi:tetratricopeptide (TPR) repeat protein